MSFILYIIIQFIMYSIFIFMVHYVFHYIKDNYTTKKYVNLDKHSKEKYQEMMNQIESQHSMIPFQSSTPFSKEQSKYLQDSLLDVLKTEGGI